LPPARDPRPIAAEARRVGRHPASRRIGVVGGSGILVLGSQSIIHGHHDAVGGRGDPRAQALVGIEVAHHPAAAVVIDEHRQ